MNNDLQFIDTNNLQFSDDAVINYYDKVVDDGLYDFETEFLKQNSFKNFKNLNILNLGCGAGREAIQFAKLGACVVGLDCSEKMLSQANEKALEQNLSIEFILSNTFNFTSEIKFDLIFGTHNFISHVIGTKNRVTLLKHIKSFLSENGSLVLSFHNRLDENSKHFHYWQSLENSFQAKESYLDYKLELGDSFIPIINEKEAKLLFHFFSLKEIEQEGSDSGLKLILASPIYNLASSKFKWSNSVWFISFTKP